MTHFKLPRSAFIGFDNIFDELDKLSNQSTGDNYPPTTFLTRYTTPMIMAWLKQERG